MFNEQTLRTILHEVRSHETYGKASSKFGFVCGVSGDGKGSEGKSKEAEIPIKQKKEPVRKDVKLCLACADGLTDLKVAMHSTGNCAVWKALSLKEKVNCVKCPVGGKNTKHTTSECKKEKLKCHNCNEENSHHTWFCTKQKAKTNSTFTKSASGASAALPPVIVKTRFVSAVSPINNMSGKIGAMFDDCSSDHYITHEAAKRYNFPSREVILEVEGIAGINQTLNTVIYTVTLVDVNGRKHEYECYGLDKVATADVPTSDSFKKICSKFIVKQFTFSHICYNRRQNRVGPPLESN